jgi:hypothetical protein
MSVSGGGRAPLTREESMLLGGAANAVTLAGAASAVWAAWRALSRANRADRPSPGRSTTADGAGALVKP